MEINKIIYKIIKISFTVLVVLLVVFGTTKLSMTAFDFGYRVFTESAIDEKPGTNVIVTISKETKESDLGEILYNKGLVRDANLFTLQLKLSAYSGKIVPGTYNLNTSMTPKEMIIVMAHVEIETEE